MLTKKEFAAKMDHSCLGTHVPQKEVEKFCREAIDYGFAAVYVNPHDVPLASRLLKGTAVKVGTVVGFPQGTASTKVKIFEALDSIENGADELDLVLNVSRLKDGDVDYVRAELNDFVSAVKARSADVLVKVIIECHYLTHSEKIIATNLVAESGADYVKQATGTTPNWSFTLGDVKLLAVTAAGRCKVKSSGWIMNIEDAIGSIEFGAERVGNSLAIQWLEEFDENVWYQ
ncbi:MAG: deoxyribose-phosphate aldolase [Clostridia bacterium]|nr:deoxyribose-phosphate aldolase [Clostridia bacterium]